MRPSQGAENAASALPPSHASSFRTITVGAGIAPAQPFGSRTLPPVGTCTPPCRWLCYYYSTVLPICKCCRPPSAKTPRHDKAAQPPLRLEMPARSGAFSGAAPREMRAADAGFGKGQPDAGTGTDRKKRRRQRHRANGTSARTFPVSESLPPTRAAGTSGRSRRRPRDVYPEHCHCAAAANVVGY